jgi:hypothetical protein
MKIPRILLAPGLLSKMLAGLLAGISWAGLLPFSYSGVWDEIPTAHNTSLLQRLLLPPNGSRSHYRICIDL